MFSSDTIGMRGYFLRNASQIILLAVVSAFVSGLPSALKSAIFFQSASLVPL